jgi:tetratricopeptide (TPR) repeat protein
MRFSRPLCLLLLAAAVAAVIAFYLSHQTSDHPPPLADQLELSPDELDWLRRNGEYDRLDWVARMAIGDGNYDLAIETCSQAVQLNPDSPVAYGNRATAYLKKGDYKACLSDWDEVLRRSPTPEGKAITYVDRSGAYIDMGKYEQAIEDCKEALHQAPGNAGAYNDMAWIAATCPDAKLRDGRNAFEYARKACELSAYTLESGDGSLMDTLAAAYAECGDFKAAVEWQTKAMKAAVTNNPGNVSHANAMSERLKLYQQKKPYRMEKHRTS